MTTSTYAGATRFELELEFVTLLGNPHYLHHLATTPASSIPPSSFTFATSLQNTTVHTASTSNGSLLQQPNFVAYLKYLLYWTQPAYLKYLSYPESTLHCLRLLQEEKFRKDLCRSQGWDVCARLIESMSVALREDAEKGNETADGTTKDAAMENGTLEVAG